MWYVGTILQLAAETPVCKVTCTVVIHVHSILHCKHSVLCTFHVCSICSVQVVIHSVQVVVHSVQVVVHSVQVVVHSVQVVVHSVQVVVHSVQVVIHSVQALSGDCNTWWWYYSMLCAKFYLQCTVCVLQFVFVGCCSMFRV